MRAILLTVLFLAGIVEGEFYNPDYQYVVVTRHRQENMRAPTYPATYETVLRHEWFYGQDKAIAWANDDWGEFDFDKQHYQGGVDNVVAILEAERIPLVKEKAGIAKQKHQVEETVAEDVIGLKRKGVNSKP